MVSHGRVEILLVQDDPADRLLVRDDFAAHKVANHLEAVSDAATALAYLDGSAPFGAAHVPDLVLLDVNLPGRDGRMVLRRLRSAPETVETPVVLLVDSSAAEQILRSENLPVQGYARKPVDFDCLVSIVRRIRSLGFEVLRSP